MPAKKRTGAKRKAAKKTNQSASPSQLAQLRSMVSQLRTRIEKEARARRIDSRLLTDARRAGDQLVRQIGALRDQGKKLAEQVRDTLIDAKKREKARQDALAVVAELRDELARRTEELRRKSAELRTLAQESAGRARDIISGESRTTSEGEEPTEHEGGRHEP